MTIKQIYTGRQTTLKKTIVLLLISAQLIAISTLATAACVTDKLSVAGGYRLIRPQGLAYSAAELDLGYRVFTSGNFTVTAIVDMYSLPVNTTSNVKQLESSIGLVGDYTLVNFNGIKPFVSAGADYTFTSQPVRLGLQFGVGVGIDSIANWPIQLRVDQFYWDTYRKDVRGSIQVAFTIADEKPAAPAPVPAPAPVVAPAPVPVLIPVVAPAPVIVIAPVSTKNADTDLDGVPNSIDECQQTPQGVTVDAYGCAIDSDKDGVADFEDACPGTEPNSVVDKTGCAIGIKNTFQFEIGKTTVGNKYDSTLDEIAKVINENPKVTIELQGFADQSGSKAYNLQLSLLRAKAVESILINKYKIDKGRLSTVGFGSDKPLVVSQVKTEMGANRRVEVRVLFNATAPTSDATAAPAR